MDRKASQSELLKVPATSVFCLEVYCSIVKTRIDPPNNGVFKAGLAFRLLDFPVILIQPKSTKSVIELPPPNTYNRIIDFNAGKSYIHSPSKMYYRHDPSTCVSCVIRYQMPVFIDRTVISVSFDPVRQCHSCIDSCIDSCTDSLIECLIVG